MRRAAERRRLALGDEAPGDRLVEPARGGGAAHPALDHLRARRGRPGDAVGARQRRRRHGVIARRSATTSSTRSAGPSTSRRQRRHAPPRRPSTAKPSALEDRALALGRARRSRPAPASAPGRTRRACASTGGVAGARHRGSPRRRKCRGSARSAIASPSSRKAGSTPRSKRLRASLVSASSWPVRAIRSGVEIGAFDQDVGGRLGDPAMLAAHDPADVVDAVVVGDHRHRRTSSV